MSGGFDVSMCPSEQCLCGPFSWWLSQAAQQGSLHQNNSCPARSSAPSLIAGASRSGLPERQRIQRDVRNPSTVQRWGQKLLSVGVSPGPAEPQPARGAPCPLLSPCPHRQCWTQPWPLGLAGADGKRLLTTVQEGGLFFKQ